MRSSCISRTVQGRGGREETTDDCIRPARLQQLVRAVGRSSIMTDRQCRVILLATNDSSPVGQRRQIILTRTTINQNSIKTPRRELQAEIHAAPAPVANFQFQRTPDKPALIQCRPPAWCSTIYARPVTLEDRATVCS